MQFQIKKTKAISYISGMVFSFALAIMPDLAA